ncbi:unnamed protein product [Oncorhynchus mykiss]|uniref:Alkylated DNA repair protein AlkB homologue 8 N-terminal domain-containing protein n=1 Tax=Oncorhynchus mykiss TaxID=8022 RepID=A0A060WHK3_ONCMY|nr:unnamed protein product [Oncorhynchus mykiss]
MTPCCPHSREFFQATVLLHLHCLLFGVLGWVSVQQALQGDLENIRKWVCQNKLALNTKKTKVMLVCSTRKRPKQHGIQLSMGGVQIEEVAETKLLGVQLDNCLSWSSQITNLCKKIYIKTTCIIRRIAKYLPGKILQQITQALVESQVNYCLVVWGNASSSEVRRLQNAQNKAARIVLRRRYGSSVAVMRSVVGWSSIDKIIEKTCLFYFIIYII